MTLPNNLDSEKKFAYIKGDIDVDMSVQYLSTGANRQTAVADWGKRDTLAFGADINIALWSPKVSERAFQMANKMSANQSK